MIFHFGFELPVPPERPFLDHESSDLTDEEMRIIRDQIRKNSFVIDDFVRKLDLLVNREKYPGSDPVVLRMRAKLTILMEENNTFRDLLWTTVQKREMVATHLQS